MTNLTESLKKGPVMIMTLKCETEFPKALKNLMISMGMQGEAVYKGFPMIEEGEEYWWVQLHLYKNKEDDHKKMGLWMFTNSEMHTSFLDSARCAAWSAIKELGERLKWRLHNTQGPQGRKRRYYCTEGNHKSTSKRNGTVSIGSYCSRRPHHNQG
jgi:hypothetical protein